MFEHKKYKMFSFFSYSTSFFVNFQKSYANQQLLSYLPNILPLYQPFFQLFTIT